VLDRVDFLLRMRLHGAARGVGIAFGAVLAVSLLCFFTWGNGRVARILYFPAAEGGGRVAEMRLVTRHAGLEASVRELVDSVLLGPTSPGAERLFARGAVVSAVMVSGRTVYLDLTPQVLMDDPETHRRGQEAFDILTRSLRRNFPRFGEVIYLIDGQVPHFPDKKKI
jgi:hypothetical protein